MEGSVDGVSAGLVLERVRECGSAGPGGTEERDAESKY
jgi:hypothetical protein